jgi:DNA recombination-dependent growth factor C
MSHLEKNHEKRKKKGKEQLTLDDVVVKEAFPKEFSREAILRAVTQFVICDDQVCS